MNKVALNICVHKFSDCLGKLAKATFKKYDFCACFPRNVSKDKARGGNKRRRKRSEVPFIWVGWLHRSGRTTLWLTFPLTSYGTFRQLDWLSLTSFKNLDKKVIDAEKLWLIRFVLSIFPGVGYYGIQWLGR